MSHSCYHFNTSHLNRLMFISLVVFLVWTSLPADDVNASDGTPDVREPVLAADLNNGPDNSSPQEFLAVNSSLFFSADDSRYGTELWISVPPYNLESTWRITDINPGTGNADPHHLAAVGNAVFFSATDGMNGYELWRTEPPYTQAFLVADLNPSGSSNPASLAVIGTNLFFQATDGTLGVELWKTAPPYNSVVLVEDIFVGGGNASPDHLTTLGWTLFFSADDSSGRELWKSQPPYIPETTEKVSRINPAGNAEPDELTVLGTKLFFTAVDSERGEEVWMIDPPYDITDTRELDDIQVRDYPSSPYGLTALGDTLFFSSFRIFSGVELRKAEPPYNATNTFRVTDINEGSASSFPEHMFAIGSTLFFSASDGTSGKELWKTNPPYVEAFQVADIQEGPGSSDPEQFTALGSTLYFTANDGIYGRELWKSEAPYTDATTIIVADIYRGASSSNPQELTVIDRTLLFRANDGDHGYELWKLGGGFLLPATGFRPGVQSFVPDQSLEYQSFNQMQLVIPDMGLDVPIVGIPVSADGWNLNWLENQAGFLEGTAFPTYPGNTVITGHAYRSDGLSGPFVNLDQLGWGDQLEIVAWNNRHVYEVRDILLVSPDDTEVITHEERDWVTLITCKDYDENLGDYRWRLVVRAVLIGVYPLPE